MIKTIVSILVIALLLKGQFLFAQGFTMNVPPSANAAQLGMAMDGGVHSFTGVSPVTIPLYSFNSGKLSHSVSLVYSSAGNRVDDAASWVGLGFSLDVGGTITRTVRGLPDEKQDGFFNGSPSLQTVNADITLLQKAADNKIDTHPDVFYYNFEGYSGRMMFDRQGNINLIPQKNFKVIKDPSLSSFVITTPDGKKYSFNAVETAKVNSSEYHSSLTTSFVSCWYLTSIQSADNISQITFEYSTPVSQLRGISAAENYYTTYNYGRYDKTKTESFSYSVEYNTPMLEKINFNNGYVKLVRGARQEGFYKLDRLEINYKNDELLKEVVFDYSYFIYPSSNTRKLKLNSFWMQSNGVKENPYKFEYAGITQSVTDVSKAQDHWGYFNGRKQTTLIPQQFKVLNPVENMGDDDYVFVQGSDLTADFNATQSFMLTKIIYPTGGRTEYQYELNEANYPSIPRVVRSNSIKISTADPVTKAFTVSGGGGSNRAVAAIITITSVCGVIPGNGVADPCAPNAPVSLQATCPYIELIGPTPRVWNCRFSNQKEEFLLTNGSYQLKVTSNLSKEFSADLYFYTVDPPAQNQVNNKAGGIRILRVKTYSDANDTNPVVKKYTYNDDEGKTTGKLNSDLNYNDELYTAGKTEFGDDMQGQLGCKLTKYYVSKTISSKVSFGLTPNFVVGYSRITELNGEEGENGKTEYYFYSADDYSNNYNLNINQWKRGLLEKRIVYAKSGSIFKKQKQSLVNYNFISYPTGYKKKIEGYSVGVATKESDGCTLGRNKYTVLKYDVMSDWFFVENTTNTNYDDIGNAISESVNVEYDYKNLLPIRTTSSTSESEKKVIIQTNYPGNYSDDDSFISDLKNNHIIGMPIEVITYVKNGSQNQNGEIEIIAGSIHTFKRGDNSAANYVGRSEALYELILPNGDPIALSDFTFSNALKGQIPDGSAPRNFSLNDEQFLLSQKILENDASSGNPIKVMDRAGMTTSVLWGYDKYLMTCKAMKSREIRYSSFENLNEPGGWIYNDVLIPKSANEKAKTGNNYYDLNNGNISSGGLNPSGTYEVCFWAKGGIPAVSGSVQGNGGTGVEDSNGWKFFSHLVSGAGPVIISGVNIFIDELRLAEKDSEIQTFTFDPLKGKTSFADSDGKMVIYEYDNLGRLKLLRDEKGFILKHYAYGMAPSK